MKKALGRKCNFLTSEKRREMIKLDREKSNMTANGVQYLATSQGTRQVKQPKDRKEVQKETLGGGG